jgi:hypothetical protein
MRVSELVSALSVFTKCPPGVPLLHLPFTLLVCSLQVRVSLNVFNLPTIAAAHIHGGPNGFAASVPVLATISNSTSYNKGIFVIPSTECWALLSGNAYINIHTIANPGG